MTTSPPDRNRTHPEHGAAVLRSLQNLDAYLFHTIADYHSPLLDRTMPLLSDSANYSGIWIVITAGIGLFGGHERRRVAARGLVSVGVSSFLANIVVKGLAPRARPAADAVPTVRRIDQPASSSFPSGHSASAAAFSGVVGRALPMLHVPLTVLAAVVAFSRVYTGVHYPADVLGGWLLGRSVARVVTRLWPEPGRASSGAP